MSDDPLTAARALLAAGRADEALRLAWDATMPAVLSQDDEQLRASAEFATQVAEVAEGGTREEAQQNAAYWLACISEPRDMQASAWSFRQWFTRAPKEQRMPCPQCAESIVVGAHGCRFCGHTL